MPGPHAGLHHYAPCGEWRPAPGNHQCTDCQARCPGCGSHYAFRAEQQDRAEVAHGVVGEDIAAKTKNVEEAE